MAWTAFTKLMNFLDRVANVDSNSADDFNTAKDAIDELGGNSGSAPTKTVTENTTDIAAVQVQLGNVKEITTSDSPYTLESGYNRFLIDPADGNIVINLPAISGESNNSYEFIQVAAGGKVTIDGNSTEKIGGYDSLYFQSANDSLKITAGTTQWNINNYYAKYDTGWINTNDWTTRHLGSSTFDYDNRSTGGADHFIIGEVVTEATSGNTGIIQSDTDGATTGTIIVKNITGTGIFTDGRQLTGSTSGTTADINESTSNKNVDSNIFHDCNFGLEHLEIELYVSTDGTEANSNSGIGRGSNGSANYSLGYIYIDSESVLFQTGVSGLLMSLDTGGTNNLDSDDYYYKMIIEVRI